MKLLDFTEEELTASTNLFAVIVQAHRAAQATRHDPVGRVAVKIRLIRRLYRLGLGRERIVDLYRFIDWLLRLPRALDEETWREIRVIAEEEQMPYITFAERYGREQGLEEGLEQGERRGLLTGIAAMLNLRFGEAGADVLPQVQAIGDVARLEAILRRSATAASLDEVRALAEAAAGDMGEGGGR